MGINKIQYGNTTLIDLTADTVTADKLLQGYTAHDRTGTIITGTASGGGDTPVWQGSDDYVYLSDTAQAPVEIYVDDYGYVVLDMEPAPLNLQTKTATYTPTESQQSATITADIGYDGLEEVDITVNAISATYVGSGIARRSSSDLTASGATVTVPSGYYSAQASKAVASGTDGTPTATKGAVSNHSISVTPSVTNTAGYISGGTKTGTAVSVSASELVSGTYSVTGSGTKDVTNYASVSVPSGTEGTPTATKGTVSNHSITVTPSVTNTTGYITGSTKTGTAVTVSASELVSGNLPITQNGNNIDCANYSTVSVNVSGGVDIPTFTVTYNGSTPTVTCDKTYDDAEGLYFDGNYTALVTFDGVVFYTASIYDYDGSLVYAIYDEGLPFADIHFASNGTITYVEPSDIPSGGGAATLVTGSFTTGSTNNTSETTTVNYSGNGFPLSLFVYTSSEINNYFVGTYSATKNNDTEPSYTTATDVNNLTTAIYVYKSTTFYAPAIKTNTATYIGSSYTTSNAYNCIKFIGSATNLGYYIGNGTSTTHGLAPSTVYNYLIVYSS